MNLRKKMVEEQTNQDQVSFLLSSFNTRLRDLEERNRIMKERLILLGENLIAIREEIIDEVKELKKQTLKLQVDNEKLKTLTQNILIETDNFARKGEIGVVERMLKDFQPLEFMRKKDVENMINRKLKK